MNNIIDYISEPLFKETMLKMENAKTSEEARAILDERNAIEESFTPEERRRYADNVIADVYAIIGAVDEDIEALRAEKIRQKIGELDKAISFAYIAKHYFGKSQSWLLQRLNGSKVNGKEAHFNKSEVMQLQDAIHDLGHKLSNLMLL